MCLQMQNRYIDMGYYNNIQDAAKELHEILNNIRVAAAVSTCNAIVIGTPVDTGRARANWQPTVNTPAQGETGSGTEASAEFGTSTLNDTLYFANNLPYIEPLEQGHSQQQPNGWVRVTVAAGQSALDSAVTKVVK